MTMKAKDMKARFFAVTGDDSAKVLTELGNEMLAETKELAAQRKISGDGAMIALLVQQDQKWRAFAGGVTGVNPSGFLALIKEGNSELWTKLTQAGAAATFKDGSLKIRPRPKLALSEVQPKKRQERERR